MIPRLLIALLLLPTLASAQVAPIWPGVRAPIFGVPVASSGVTSGGVVTSPQLLWPNGTVLLPGLAPASDPNTGWYWTSDGAILMSINGVLTHQWGNTYYANSSDSACMQFGAAGDATICRAAGPVWNHAISGTNKLTLSNTAVTSTVPISISNSAFSTGVGRGTYFTAGNGTNELYALTVDANDHAALFLGKVGVADASIYSRGNTLYFGAASTIYGQLTSAAFRAQNDNVLSLGASGQRWTEVFSNAYTLASKAFINTAPTIPVACTSPTVTWSNGTATFQVDVGTTCSGISTLALTMPAVTNAWMCDAMNVTTSATGRMEMTASTTTSVTFTSYTRTTGLALVFADGTDVLIKCSGG